MRVKLSKPIYPKTLNDSSTCGCVNLEDKDLHWIETWHEINTIQDWELLGKNKTFIVSVERDDQGTYLDIEFLEME